MTATIFYDDILVYHEDMSRTVGEAPEKISCARCKIIKPLADFPVRTTKGKARYWSYCISCSNSYQRDQRASDPDANEKARAYYRENAERKRELARNCRTPEKTKSGALRKYGITLSEYLTLLENQHGVCAVCKRPPRGRRKFLAVDHNHKTGDIRGLLCITCNVGLGALGDSTELLYAALAYLERGGAK